VLVLILSPAVKEIPLQDMERDFVFRLFSGKMLENKTIMFSLDMRPIFTSL
jgi:hypothetical protein